MGCQHRGIQIDWCANMLKLTHDHSDFHFSEDNISPLDGHEGMQLMLTNQIGEILIRLEFQALTGLRTLKLKP